MFKVVQGAVALMVIVVCAVWGGAAEEIYKLCGSADSKVGGG